MSGIDELREALRVAHATCRVCRGVRVIENQMAAPKECVDDCHAAIDAAVRKALEVAAFLVDEKPYRGGRYIRDIIHGLFPSEDGK